MSFNFCRLCTKANKFNYQGCRSKYFHKLLERLRDISKMNRNEMTIQNRVALRCHQIDFKNCDVSENTFGLGQDIDDEAWQFQLTSKLKKGV